jgi:hypothetical protein
MDLDLEVRQLLGNVSQGIGHEQLVPTDKDKAGLRASPGNRNDVIGVYYRITNVRG